MNKIISDIKAILKDILSIYPFPFLVIILAPYIFYSLIDYRVVEFRSVVNDLIWLSFFTVFAIFARKSFYLRIILFFYFIAGLLQLIHWSLIKGPITVTSILVLLNTNVSEASEFIDLKLSFNVIYILVYILIYLWSSRFMKKQSFFRSNKYFALIFLSLSLFYILENAINQRLVRKGVPDIIKVGFSLKDRLMLYNEAAKDVSPKEIPAYLNNKKQKIFALVIGESCSRKHMSLYGYPHKTTPLLDKRTDLLIYKDVISPYSNTLDVILSAFSNSNLETQYQSNTRIDLIDVFHSAGFKTFWISNQSPIGVWDNQVTVLANQSDIVKFVNLTSNSSFEATYSVSYDEKLFPEFFKVLQDTASFKFIVVHMMGSHSKYNKRYPKSFAKFAEGDSDKSTIIAEYDNSILYSDFIVDSLISMFSVATQGRISSFMYMSDHGENVYDNGNTVGHDFVKNIPSVNVEIPFLVWISEEFKKLNVSKYNDLILAQDKPFITDDLYHSILDLNFIETESLDRTRSLFNSLYNDKRKRILCDGFDYDTKTDF